MTQIRLNAFETNRVGLALPGLWSHFDDRLTKHGSLGRCDKIARMLERGLFLADILGVYGGWASPGIRHTVQNPVGDTFHPTTGAYADPRKRQPVQHAELHRFSAGDGLPPKHPAVAHCGNPA